MPGGIGTVQYAVSLGDITGEGFPTFAVEMNSPIGVKYVQPSRQVPETGKYRYMPPGTGTPETGVEDKARDEGSSDGLGLQAWPNPSSGIVRLSWRSTTGTATILITDQLGQTVAQFQSDGSAGEAEWDASQTFGAVYFVSVAVDGVHESTEVHVQR